MLADQEQEIQELKGQLQEKERQLEQRRLCMAKAGNIAQAALALNGVFEAAQKAADQYLESVKEMAGKHRETRSRQMIVSAPTQVKHEDPEPKESMDKLRSYLSELLMEDEE